MKITAGQLAEMLGAVLIGDSSSEIEGVAKIEDAAPTDVTFVADSKYRKYLGTTRAGAIILSEPGESVDTTYLVCDDPQKAFLQAVKHFHSGTLSFEKGVHPSAVIGSNVTLGEEVSIGPGSVLEDGVIIGDRTVLRAQCFVGRDASIGADCLIHSRVSIREDCQLGNRVVLQDGVVVGSDGFGFARQEDQYEKIPQVGRVVIEDDVEIGANATIDRASLGETRICSGVKLDNLVQIAHNVKVGKNTVMSAQTGIAGSTKIGEHCMFGGQVGISGHISISDGIMVAAQSGVTKDPGPKKVIGGYPAREIHKWRRIEGALTFLPDLIKRIREIEKKISNS